MSWLRALWMSTIVSAAAACGPGELASDPETTAGQSTGVGTTGVDTDAVGAGFVGHYYSPWGAAFLHFEDGSGWTEPPGLETAGPVVRDQRDQRLRSRHATGPPLVPP